MRSIIIYVYDSDEFYKLVINLNNEVIDVQKFKEPAGAYTLKVTKADWEKYYAYYKLIGSDALKHYVRAYLNSNPYLVGIPRNTYRDDITDAFGFFANSRLKSDAFGNSIAVTSTPSSSNKSYFKDFAKKYLSNL